MSFSSNEEPLQDRQYVTALARGLQILRCFSHAEPEWSLSEIVIKTGLPQPTVWRLCHTLRKEGFLVASASGSRLKLGLPALALGYAAISHQSLPELAKPYMQALTDKYRLGTALAVRDGMEVMYIQRTHGDFIYLNDPVGARRSFALAATGWACFVAYPSVLREHLLAQLERTDPALYRQSVQALRNAVEQYAEQGFITNIGIVHERLNTVAIPICSLNSDAIYGLSVSGLSSDWPEKKLFDIGHQLKGLAQDLAVVAD